MCVSGNYLKTRNTARGYKAFRYFRFDWGTRTKLASVYYGGVWNGKLKTAPSVSEYTSGNSGLHSVATLNAARREAGGGRPIAQIRAFGKVALFGRGKKVTGYLSTKQKIVKIFLPRSDRYYAPSLRRRYGVPVILNGRK